MSWLIKDATFPVFFSFVFFFSFQIGFLLVSVFNFSKAPSLTYQGSPFATPSQNHICTEDKLYSGGL